MERSTVVLLSILSFALVGTVGAEEEPDLLNGEFWKAQVLDEFIPLWYDDVQRKPPYTPVQEPRMQNWWVQIYGAFLQLQLYHITQDEQYLEQFQKMEGFFLRRFVDREYGGIFATVTPDGEFLGDGCKAAVWHTSYHEIEHGLLNYLYLNLYVNRKPAVLHFRLNGGEGRTKHFVSLVDDPAVEIAGVRIDGEIWTEFDARERSVRLPVEGGLRVEVELRPGN